MNLSPQASGTRPRIACEISAAGIVAARSESATTPLTAVARVKLSAGAVTPSLRPGNIADRVAVAAAVRKALEDTGVKGNTRGADMTLIIPDSAARVLFLDFDALPNKLSEALPLVRFRLKKMLPFDADESMVSYQVMSSSKSVVRVLAVAIPRGVLAEYESVAREAGFEPGAVIPSTLAALAGVDDSGDAALLINANATGVTTAISRDGLLLLHRSVDLQPHAVGTPANLPPALFEPSEAMLQAASLPLVDPHLSAAEWAAQEPLPEHGRNPYADRAGDESAVQNEDGITGLQVPPVFLAEPATQRAYSEPAPIAHSPYAANTVTADLYAEKHNSILIAPTTLGEFADEVLRDPAMAAGAVFASQPASTQLTASDLETEIAQAVSVATAYYEDTLAKAPTRLLAAGPLGADALQRMLTEAGVAQSDGLQVREIVTSEALLPSAVTSSVPRGWLAGVAGALRG